jgi:ferredoxin/flavodoxin---NADP+ reductase
MPKWCPSRVVDKQLWADGLFTLKIDAAGVQPFEAGQFLHLAVQEGDDIINRPYSVASPHGAAIEFFIVKVNDGKLTPILDRLAVGDPVMVSERAAGSFTLKKAPVAKNLWLIGTGTGLAPFIAMLRDHEAWERYERIFVVHGTRHATDLGYRDELCNLQRERPARFRYLPAVTREQKDGLLHGRLTTLLADGRLEQAAGTKIDAANSTVMICGNPDMLDEMENDLVNRGLKRHKSKEPGHIVVERYW